MEGGRERKDGEVRRGNGDWRSEEEVEGERRAGGVKSSLQEAGRGWKRLKG